MIAIRHALPEDLAAVTRIERLCFPPEQAAGHAALARRLNVFPGHFLLAEVDGVLAGFVNGAVIDRRYLSDEMYKDVSCHREDGAYQSVFGLDVLPEYRGRGLARRLMARLVEQARTEGRKGVTLTCLAEKIAFYSAMGFACEGCSASTHGNAVWYNMLLDIS